MQAITQQVEITAGINGFMRNLVDRLFDDDSGYLEKVMFEMGYVDEEGVPIGCPCCGSERMWQLDDNVEKYECECGYYGIKEDGYWFYCPEEAC